MSAEVVRVRLADSDGRKHELEVPVGASIMQTAVSRGVTGIVAECGGNAGCGTCHVFVESAGAELPEMSSDEDEMLDWTAVPRRPGSRLACQLVLEPSNDPVVIQVAERQK